VAAACLVTIVATAVAQEVDASILDRFGSVQADEIVLDARGNRLTIRGNVRIPDSGQPGYEIDCDLNHGVLSITNRILLTDDRYLVGVAACNALVDMFRRDGRLR
jgi:hypothetical protein